MHIAFIYSTQCTGRVNKLDAFFSSSSTRFIIALSLPLSLSLFPLSPALSREWNNKTAAERRQMFLIGGGGRLTG